MSYVIEPAIVFSSVSKRFRKQTLSKKGYTTIKTHLIGQLFSRKKRDINYTEVLEDISFKVEKGSSLGLIGRNGSGKSTLLKIISGIYKPDSGVVKVNGRMSALIELGAGFHPDFTGRENIFLGGIMYGLSRKQIEEKFDDIVKYSELEDFIDDPVRTYSSGMYMRLGFSLAVHTDPDILLIDEVLAVGDAAFIYRCQDTISDFRRRGKTFVFVTHDLSAVTRWCDEVLWLDSGRVRERGKPRQVVDFYLRKINEVEEKTLESENQYVNASKMKKTTSGEKLEELILDSAATPSSPEQKTWGSGEAEIISVKMKDSLGAEKWLFHFDESVQIEVGYRISKPIDNLVFGIGLIRADGVEVHGNNTMIDDVKIRLPDFMKTKLPVEGAYIYNIKRLGLVEDTYYLDVALHREDGFPFDYHHRLHKFSVRSQQRSTGAYVPEHTWRIILNDEVVGS